MRRCVDWYCECGRREPDVMADESDIRICSSCHVAMQQDWLPRVHRDAQWDDRTAVLVHVTNDPSVPADARVRYVGSHDAKLKPGYERRYLRSLREVEKFEREQNVRSEMAWYDKGTARGFDDEVFGNKVTH